MAWWISCSSTRTRSPICSRSSALASASSRVRVRRAQPVLRLLARQTAADVVGDEGQQLLVALGEAHVRRIALHRDHADHRVLAQQRHAQPAVRERAVAAQHALVLELRDPLAVGQQRAPGTEHELGHALAQGAAGAHRVAFVDRVRELQPRAVLAEQRDVEVARVQQFAHHVVDLGIEPLQGLGRDRQLGDPEQRALQPLGALALDDLRLQLAVGLLQGAGALLDPALEFLAGAVAVERGQDVLGDEGQQRPLLLAVAVAVVVALDHDRAGDAAVAQHRHPQPVLAVGAVGHVARHAQPRPHQFRGPLHRLAQAQQGQGQAVGGVLGADLDRRIGLVRILAVGEIDEAEAVALVVVQHDVEVLGVHQAGDDGVDPAQQFLHVQRRAGQVGDLEQRLLQALGLLQRFDPRLRPLLGQGGVDRASGQRDPGLARAGRQRFGEGGRQ
jgi:hypothetical protein